MSEMMHTKGKVAPIDCYAVGQSIGLYADANHETIAWVQESNSDADANAARLVALWNAADGLTNDEAVKRLGRGPSNAERVEAASNATATGKRTDLLRYMRLKRRNKV